MEMASTTEQAFNFAFGDVLREKHPLWKDALGVEQTHVLQGAAGKQPDLILSPPGTSPVAVETEFTPAATVEEDAVSRLGEQLASDGRTIEMPSHCGFRPNCGPSGKAESRTPSGKRISPIVFFPKPKAGAAKGGPKRAGFKATLTT